MTNCPNCGAAMDLAGSRDYLRCRHCGTYQFPRPVEADGIRIVGHVPEAPRCPVCERPLAHAILDDQHPVDFCMTCRGLLLPRPTFAHVTNTRRAWATTPPIEPAPLDSGDLARKLACPTCGGAFETYPHYGPGNVVIDNCTACDLIWLDYGELGRIVDAPGRDRGSRHTPRVDDEYVRTGPQGSSEDGAEPNGVDPLAFLIRTVFGR